ncbi:hypothetical protein [Streptomyces oceani]|uniref:PknH-like extracellular domain-containing protein n=1 Tax=Streptomyces oceani TaxID=1075402 RepID=A0A1E7KGZ3_9ACTN|nr:hypothetical protein [Streptomyces oceani]OEV03195.1 hypothetical protein AN216_12675 [Streptomyces oceani]
MHKSSRVMAAAAAGVATVAVVAGVATASPDATATRPGFLAAGDLPPHPSESWRAGEVTQGLPDPLPFCVADTLPAGDRTYHRDFSTGLDTEAVQVSTTAETPDQAAELAGQLRDSVERCTERWLEKYPEGTAEWQDHGTVDTADGGHLYATHTALPNSSHNVHLFGVGMDGRKVTVVQWGQMGTFGDAPAKDFRETLNTALNKL